MTGTGTQADPYMITTVAEFRSMNDSTAYYKLANDLDVNDSEWASSWTEATIACTRVDFDGYELRNINYNGTAGAFYTANNIEFYQAKIKNIVITGNEACFCRAKSDAIIVSFTGTEEKSAELSLTFSGDMSESRGMLSGLGTLRLTNFAANIQAVSNKFAYGLGSSDSSTYPATKLINVHIKFDWRVTSDTSGSIAGSWNNSGVCRNVKISGKFSADENATQSTFGLLNFGMSYTQAQCYCSAEFENISSVSFNNGYAPTGTCFYDYEKAGITFTTQTNLFALTTAQCKDKDYLNSIGFVVV